MNEKKYSPIKTFVKGLSILLLTLIIFLVALLQHHNMVNHAKTMLVIKNGNDTNSVLVYVTLGCPDTTKWQSNVNGMFGITATGLQGAFYLAPGQQVSYTSKKALQGNVCFNSAPVNCPQKVTVCEFCLNNAGTSKNAQETTEISCVSGVSFIASITLQGSKWTANYPGYDTVTTIQNGPIGTNSGRVGVYPFGCDDCTMATSGAPSCTQGKNEVPQKHAICNVQRNARYSGGTVTITYLQNQ